MELYYYSYIGGMLYHYTGPILSWSYSTTHILVVCCTITLGWFSRGAILLLIYWWYVCHNTGLILSWSYTTTHMLVVCWTITLGWFSRWAINQSSNPSLNHSKQSLISPPEISALPHINESIQKPLTPIYKGTHQVKCDQYIGNSDGILAISTLEIAAGVVQTRQVILY